jgi:hypothetical protein
MRRGLVAAAAALLVLAACTTPAHRPSRPSSSPEPGGNAVERIPHVRPGGAPTLERAIAELCVPPSVPDGTPASGALPPDLATIAHQVEIARGHTYTSPPAAEAITDQEMDRRLAESFAAYYPKQVYDRRTFAWRTIGVIGPSDDLYRAYAAYFAGEVVGFYDPETGELVYLGSGDLGFAERFTLAHELTHALDDQTFDLTRLDDLSASCQDERAEAALGLVEGSAQYFAALTLAQDPQIDLTDLLAALADAATSGAPPPGVPPFLEALQIWPYVDGEAFVADLAANGTAAVDAAFRHFPVSTEQVIHPDRFPTDRPRAVSIPDVTPALGPRWGDLDAMSIGEEWLRAMLALRLPEGEADAAAAGWDGGGYRAFSDGDHVVVILRTAWDTDADAAAFAAALHGWSSATGRASVQVAGSSVTAVFGDAQRSLRMATTALR